MNGGIGRFIGKVLLIGIPLALLLAGIVWSWGERNREERDEVTVIDKKSGLTWEMFGEPELEETTSPLAVGDGRAELETRVYTVDHGDWVERVQIIDAPPGEVDLGAAALTTFGGDGSTRLEDVEFVKIAEFDGATAPAPGTVEVGDETVDADTQVFATQINAYVLTGGVAQVDGADEVDVAAEAVTLREAIRTP